METPGPPPLTNDVINEIPICHITKEQVDANLQCSICWDNYKIDEIVKKLPCEHFYHDCCIVPWLELHGTCPICREKLYEFDALLSDDDSGEGRAAFMRYANENLSRESSSMSISSLSWTAEIFGTSLSSILQDEDETSLHTSSSSSLERYTLSNQLCEIDLNGVDKSSSSSTSSQSFEYLYPDTIQCSTQFTSVTQNVEKPSSSSSTSSSQSFEYVYPETIQCSTQFTNTSQVFIQQSFNINNTNDCSSSDSDYLGCN